MSELTPKQELFLEYLFNDPECRGNTKLAVERAGYSMAQHSQVVKALKDEILNRTKDVLALRAPEAACNLINMMYEDGSTPKAETRLKAIESVLDRVGVSKKQEMEVSTDKEFTPIFFIPAKVNAEVDNGESSD